MAVERSASAAPLLVDVDRDDPTPLGRQLERQLREAIQSCCPAGGERVPSSRALVLTHPFQPAERELGYLARCVVGDEVCGVVDEREFVAVGVAREVAAE